MEQKELNEKFVEVAKELSTLTGENWTAKPSLNSDVHLVGDVKEVVISARGSYWGEPKGKIELYVYGLKDFNKIFRCLSINVSEAKSSLQIAKDIKSRILSDMKIEAERTREEIKVTKEQAAKVLLAAEKIIAASGGLFEHDPQNHLGYKSNNDIDPFLTNLKLRFRSNNGMGANVIADLVVSMNYAYVNNEYVEVDIRADFGRLDCLSTQQTESIAKIISHE